MNDLKSQLDGLADAPRPGPSRVDVAAAVAKGRRTRRVRRAATGAGLAAAVVLGAVVVVDLPGGTDRPVLSSSAAGAAYPNPIMRPAAFGWLPKGYRTTRVIADRQDGPYVEISAAVPGRHTGVQLTVHGPGREPEIARLPGGRPGRRTAAPAVNGRPAFWTIKPGGPGSDQVPAEFRWEFAPGRWALLSVTDVHVARVDDVYRLAKSVTFTAPEPVAFPLVVKGLPPGLNIYRAIRGLVPEGPVGKAGESVADFSMTTAAKGSDRNNDLSISVFRQNPDSPKETGTNTTIDGRPAYDSALGAPTNQPRLSYVKPSLPPGHRKGQVLRVYGAKGYDIEISAYGEPWRRTQASGGLVGLYKRMTFLGTNPADWTTDPLVR
ncbi:hypothetical protein ACFVH6_35655 [Spirillospora sp. NPDC127200]